MTVSNTRIERTLRDLHAAPPVQFFQQLFALIGLGDWPQKARIAAQRPAYRSPFRGSR